MIQMKLYFASLFEYVMIWGTPIGSEGHSGRHRVAFWDTVIDGEAWYFAEGQFEKRIYRPGDRIFVGKGQACGMNFTDGVWAVEYARGPLMLSLPFGLADELLSTLDYTAALQTIAIYTTLIGRHWAAAQPRLSTSGSVQEARRLPHEAHRRCPDPGAAAAADPEKSTPPRVSRAAPPRTGRLDAFGSSARLPPGKAKVPVSYPTVSEHGEERHLAKLTGKA